MVPLLVDQVRDRRSEADVQVTTDVRSAYSGRTQSVRRTGRPAGTPTQGWSSFLTAVVSWTFLSTWLVSQFAPFPQILGLSESHRQSHSKLRPHQMSQTGGCEVQSEPPGPPLRVTARQEQVGSAALSGLPFSLKYLVYASCFSTSAGALGRMPWGIQGLFQDALSKVFSFQKEARSWSRWS